MLHLLSQREISLQLRLLRALLPSSAPVSLRPPLPKPGNIVCMAVNYMENGTLKEAAPINAFHKAPGAIIGPGDAMVLPDVPASIFEGEAEMAVVIGKRAKNVSQADAMKHIFGYINFIRLIFFTKYFGQYSSNSFFVFDNQNFRHK